MENIERNIILVFGWMHKSASADNNPIGWTKVSLFLKCTNATRCR